MKKYILICIALTACMIFISCDKKEVVNTEAPIETVTQVESVTPTETITETETTIQTQTPTQTATATPLQHSIQDVQARLKELGYVGATGKGLLTDGNFGANSQYALKRFQKNAGLSQTGKIDTVTMEKLFAQDAVKATSADKPKQQSTISINSTPKIITLKRTEIKNLIDKGVTFDELKTKYNLKIVDQSLKGSFEAESASLPHALWFFSTTKQESNTYRFSGIMASASVLFPEYVNKKIDDIPIVLEHKEKLIYMYDKFGSYNAELANPNVLSANDMVYMGAVS